LDLSHKHHLVIGGCIPISKCLRNITEDRGQKKEKVYGCPIQNALKYGRNIYGIAFLWLTRIKYVIK